MVRPWNSWEQRHMDAYTRLPQSPMPPPTAPYHIVDDSQYPSSEPETPPQASPYRSLKNLLRKLSCTNRNPEPTPQSNYLTLIPLSDSRLKPRRTKLLVFLLLLFTLAATCGVYFLVPRGISVGTVSITSEEMSWNSTLGTYQLLLQADIPIFNPNYIQASVSGNLEVLFYDQQAGRVQVGPITVERNSLPQVLSIRVDASNVPRKYDSVLVDQCRTFPRRLIFFLNGNLQVKYLGKAYSLPRIDTYFMISCINSRQVGTAG